MDDAGWRRIRGLKGLIHFGVDQGARFVERHHRDAADRTFRLLEGVAPIAETAQAVRAVHSDWLSLTYGGVRTANRLVATAGDWVVEALKAGHGDAPVAAAPGTRGPDAAPDAGRPDP